MESNAVLELKAKNAKLKAELKAERWKHVGYQEEALKHKNMELNLLRRVWCSGGCCGGLQKPLTAEMVAYAEEYAARLRTWYIAHAGKTAPRVRELKPPPNHYLVGDAHEQWMKAYEDSWGNAKEAIDFARKKFEEIECQQ